jgi:fibronectin-binding autotransporter adhesin
MRDDFFLACADAFFLKGRMAIEGKHIMNSYRRLVFGVVGVFCFFAGTAGAQSVVHWDTSSTTGYQAGDGNWSTSGSAPSLRWSFSPTDTPDAWSNGNIASFDTSGSSLITPVNISDMTVSGMVFNGTGYTLANAGVETTVRLYLSGSATITTNVDATITASLGGAAGVGMTKDGNATLIIGGRNIWIGATTINAGTLVLDNNNQTAARLFSTSGITIASGATLKLAQTGVASIDRINNSADVSMVGGSTFNTNKLTEGTAPTGPLATDGAAGMGTLTLSSTSAAAGNHITIDFATLPTDPGNALVFSALSGAAGQYVDILNWTGTAGSDNGGANNDRLLFAADPMLSQTDLAHISFYSDSGSTLVATGATEIQYGNMIEIVPEPINLVSAASRKNHGSPITGPFFDINMPLSATLTGGDSGIECRQGGDADGGTTGDYTIVLTFDDTVTTADSATVTAHNPLGAGGTAGTPSFSGTEMIIPLSGVTNGQVLTLNVTNVTGGAGTVSADINIGFLLGDTTGNRRVNSSDVSQTKASSGAVLNSTNARMDVTVNGEINSSDVSAVKASSGTAAP